MATDALLITHRGALRVTRHDLGVDPPPPRTATWTPIKHSDLVDALHAELARCALRVRHEQYAIQKQGTMLFGTLDLAWHETENTRCPWAYAPPMTSPWPCNWPSA